MRFSDLILCRILALVVVAGFHLPVLLAAGDEKTAGPSNQSLLDRWKQDPEHYARLMQDLKEFHALDATHQEELRQFDRDFAALDSQRQKHYFSVLQRYSYWLDHLPETDRKRIESTTDATARLAVVRSLFLQQWRENLPTRTRENLQQALLKANDPDEIKKIIDRFHKEEMDRKNILSQVRQAKVQAPQSILLKPAKTEELPEELRNYLEKQLKPQLNRNEVQELQEAEGKYPQFLRTLHILGSGHLLILPSRSRKEIPTTYKTLPPEYKKAISQQKLTAPKLNTNDRHTWPLFALGVNQYARGEVKDSTSLPPLGAAEPGEFPEPVRTWIETKLLPALTPAEKKTLEMLQKKWPEYPLALPRLASSHKVPLPSGLNLPGPEMMWEAALGKGN